MPRLGDSRPGTGCACTSPPVRVHPLARFRKEDVMAQHLRDEPELVEDVMTRNPITLSETATVQEAALAMREADVGDVLVVRRDAVCESLPTATLWCGSLPKAAIRPRRRSARS